LCYKNCRAPDLHHFRPLHGNRPCRSNSQAETRSAPHPSQVPKCTGQKNSSAVNWYISGKTRRTAANMTGTSPDAPTAKSRPMLAEASKNPVLRGTAEKHSNICKCTSFRATTRKKLLFDVGFAENAAITIPSVTYVEFVRDSWIFARRRKRASYRQETASRSFRNSAQSIVGKRDRCLRDLSTNSKGWIVGTRIAELS
jgi:hypothetical protein